MKANVKRLLSMMLAIAIVIGMVPSVSAEGEAAQAGDLAALVAAVAAGGEIKLTTGIDLTEKITVESGKTVVLDLNGNTIKSESTKDYYIVNRGNLTILDSVGGGSIDGENTTSSTGYTIYNYGDLTVESGKFTNESTGGNAYVICSKGTLTINDGTFEAKYNKANGGYSAYTLGLGGTDTTATINGGTFSAESNSAQSGARCALLATLSSSSNVQITVTGGEFTSTRTASDYGASILKNDNLDTANVVIKGGSFSAGKSGTGGLFDNQKGALEISGGTFKYDGKVFNKNTKLTVAGGTFLKQDDTKNDISSAATLAAGYTQNEQGIVAQHVATSEDLVAAMEKGGNICLSADIALGAVAKVPADKTAVLDLNGKTISSTNEAYRIETAGTLTIIDSREGNKDGEIKLTPASETAAVIALRNTGTLTINGGKITATSKVKNAFAVYSEAPSVTINGGTFEANYDATGGSSAYTLGLLGDTSGTSVATINGGTFIAKSRSTGNSRCADVFANCDNSKKITITINGGTFESERKTTRTASVVRFRDSECGATVVINGGTFSAAATPNFTDDDKMFAGTMGSLTINGGTFTYDTSVFTDARKATITGGTFVKWDGTKNEIASKNFANTGCTQADNGSVARDVATSEDLVAAMQNSGGIRLTGDFTLSAMAAVPAGKTVTLDLNGKTITSTNEAYRIENNGTLIIVDSREGGKDGEIIITPANATATVIAVKNTGDLTINGGKFTASATVKTVYTIYSVAPSATINGGTYKATYTGGEDTWGSAHAVTLAGDGSDSAAATITGGTFIAESANPENARCASVYASGEDKIHITIEGGDFIGTRTVGRGGSVLRYSDTNSGATVLIKGGTFSATNEGVDGLLNNVKGYLEVAGGTFKYDGLMIYKNSRLTVTGGTFQKLDGTKNDISSYLTDDYHQLSDGTVIEGDVTGELVSELISYYNNYQDNAATDIARVLAELKVVDSALGASWEKIMNFWSAANTEGFVNVGSVPQGLPNDNSLCIVILGYALNDDGTMQDELIGRLQTGLAIANAYPNAYVCVTGGGTAANNTDVTEAGQMAAWLKENGLSEGRLIIEDKATSTVTNAKNTYDVLVANYQSVDNIVMVTSDYHVVRGSLLYYTKFVLEAQETGGKQIGIIANAGFDTDENYESVAKQAWSLCSLVGITYSELPTVELSSLTSLTVTQEAPYVTGNDLALTVTANYNSGYSKVVEATITGFDKTKGPEQIITISYSENGVTREGMFRLSETSGHIANSGTAEVNDAVGFAAAMAVGGDIRLTGDFTMSAKVEVPAGVFVMLDLNGKTITSNDSANVYISNKGNLTILDSSAEQSGTINAKEKSGSTSSSYGLVNAGELTIEGGHIKVESKNRSCYAIYSTGKSLEINGGTAEATYASTSGAYGCYMLGFGGTNSTVTINGGKFVATNKTTHVSSRSTAIYVLKESNVQININGGDFTATREGSDGASFIRWGDSSTPTITISGGKIAVTEGDTIGMFDEKKGTLLVIGGQFLNVEGNPFNIRNYLGEGYVQMDDGTIVVDDPDMPVVVELNGVKYKSLVLAMNKCSAGDVLALDADVKLEDTLVVPDTVHIDLQGNTLEVDGLIAEGSQITDSTQQGLLKVAKDQAIFVAGNEQLPVWDEAAGGYRMAQVKIQTKAAATNGVYFFRYDLVNAEWEKLLPNTLNDPDCKISMLLHVDGIETIYQVPTDMLARLYEDATGKGAIKVNFIGMEEKLDIQVGVSCREAEITKSTGVEPVPEISSNGPEGKVDNVPADVRSYMADATAKYSTGLADLVDANTTSAKSPTTKNLYKYLQPVAFNWTLENAKFIKADAKFSIELSTDPNFAQSSMVACDNYVAGRKDQSEPVWNLMTDTTYYWRVVASLADGTKIVTETKTIRTEPGPRLIRAEGAENTRDLGGWLVSHDVALSDGTVIYKADERTTQGRVYRSGRMETLTVNGIDTIVNELGIKTQIDLREANAASYDVLSAYGVDFVQRSDGKTCLDYTEFLKYPDRAKEALLVFADANNYPVIFNCYYGADRTGALAFVLGALQGVSLADLVQDYELTVSRYLHRGGSLDIKAFITGLDKLEGDNFYEKARSFCLSAGLTDAQIDAIIVNLSGK